MSDNLKIRSLDGTEVTPEIEREIRNFLAYLDAHPEPEEEDGDAWLERTLNAPMPDLSNPPKATEEEIKQAVEYFAKLEQEEPFMEE